MKVGLFDSGVGGLSVLSKMVERYPSADYVYLADTLNSPFGLKEKSDLIRIVRDDLNFLVERGVDTVVAACNTADSVMNFDVPVPYVGIIETGVSMVRGKRIVVLATEATVKLGIYGERLREREVLQIPMQELVSVVEEDPRDFKKIDSIIELRRGEILDFKPDEVILGCTHFSLISERFGKVLDGVKILDPAEGILDRLEFEPTGGGTIEIYVTSDLEGFKKKVDKLGIFKDRNVMYRQVKSREESDSHIGIVGGW